MKSNLTENEKQLFILINQIDITKATERELALQQILLYTATLMFENRLDELLVNLDTIYPEYNSRKQKDSSGAHTNPIGIDLNNLIERWNIKAKTLNECEFDGANEILEVLGYVERIIEFGSSYKLQKLIEKKFEVHEYGF
ncbi:MAG: hypothetical protein JXQ87_09005 [Bacteroidia bacterium]